MSWLGLTLFDYQRISYNFLSRLGPHKVLTTPWYCSKLKIYEELPPLSKKWNPANKFWGIFPTTSILKNPLHLHVLPEFMACMKGKSDPWKMSTFACRRRSVKLQGVGLVFSKKTKQKTWQLPKNWGGIHSGFWINTLPETNIAPENGWLEYYFPIGEAYFQGLR